ncbi:MAG: thiamine-phosphate kinase [Flavobacteriaceae bacterium]|nr:MAG: thiamine-phosphate kinase [Flavobacteriaceae bacterium]
MIEDKNISKTELGSLGEFGLIDRLTQNFSLKNPSSILGVGDDAAILETPKDQQLVLSTDFLIEGIHFDLSYMPLKHLGYKAVSVNISDICAMNATPTQITVSLAVSNRFSLEALEELYSGIALACQAYKVDLVGGDTTSSTSGLVISISAVGMAKKEKICKRSGAQNNDLLVVSGDLGAAYLGLQVLEREKQVFKANPNAQPDLANYPYLLERQLRPQARLDVIGLLEELSVKPTSMIDISDGLASEVLHLSKHSGLGFSLYEDKIPLDPSTITTAEEFGINPITAALNGGEDYELLFTVPLEDHPKIKANPNLTVIGFASNKTLNSVLIDKSGENSIPLSAQGWNHFKS